MTYFGFLLRFIVIPLVLLAFFHLWDRRRRVTLSDRHETVWLAIGVHIGLALIYTTPWDNYLVATGVWYYNPALVTGIVLGYVPIEEYAFFILETLLVGLWWWFLAKRITSPDHFIPSHKIHFWSSVVLVLFWFLSIIVFFSGWQPGTYLSITLMWALPPIIGQCAFGADILWHHRKLILATILPTTLYLSLVDSLAITATTWTISPARSSGIFISSLPLEEGVFFFVTVLLVTFGITLMTAAESSERLRHMIQNIFD